MAHYERLANGKYAYTTTIQVVANEEFTNPNRAIYQGCLIATSDISSKPSDRESAFKYIVSLNTISNSTYGITSSNCGITNTAVTLDTNSQPSLTSKVIDGETYYGLAVYNNLGFVFSRGSTNVSEYHRFFSAKTTVTYIPNGTTQIMQKQVIFNGVTTGKVSDKRYYYFGLGMSVGDVILNINVDSSGT